MAPDTPENSFQQNSPDQSSSQASSPTTGLQETRLGKDNRCVRSYVRRGRITPSQRGALAHLLPRYGIQTSGPLDLAVLFPRRAPVWLEIGFGDGDALLARAQTHAEINHLGIEVHDPGVGRVLRRLDDLGLDNVRIGHEDAVQLLAHRIVSASISRIMALFPDPWPKKRHHKRRMVQPSFAQLVAARLRVGGVFHTATDWEPYAQHMLEVLQAQPLLINLHGEGRFAPPGSGREDTKFERRGRRLGHSVWDLQFSRVHNQP
ncbi:MAG: tRNA (guanosine(46)-N7)-methyltransferase TrmB [Gammaproteobacteria bacterium]|nr:tRNA (guanosine(46)-N7)-methyltransferase TrmB [Gammaproteobacteria bacterium]